MNNDLIRREDLKFEIRQQLAFQKEKAKLTTINADKMAHSLVATGLQLAIDIIDNIDNAPASERKCYTCKFEDREVTEKPCSECCRAWTDLYKEAEDDKQRSDKSYKQK